MDHELAEMLAGFVAEHVTEHEDKFIHVDAMEEFYISLFQDLIKAGKVPSDMMIHAEHELAKARFV